MPENVLQWLGSRPTWALATLAVGALLVLLALIGSQLAGTAEHLWPSGWEDNMDELAAIAAAEPAPADPPPPADHNAGSRLYLPQLPGRHRLNQLDALREPTQPLPKLATAPAAPAIEAAPGWFAAPERAR